ncbi:MAG: F0F1 ATP synthase subunit A [Proteobacteria bacterium]|nr:F0F1 ATP synthase subunit A [Pseudomonadota bacterium]
MASPLEQFTIVPIIDIEVADIDISFTNSSLWMVITAAVLVIFMVVSTQRRALVPGRMQASAEYFYQIIADMVRDNVGSQGRPYFPFIFSIFMFILFGNLLGMVPYSFTFTSHIVVTFAMAFVVFLGVTAVGFVMHGAHFFSFFVPKGVPKVMLLLMVPIEVLSYLTRPVSLSIRLFANMMAGHTMLKVFAAFTVMLGVAPLFINVALTGFEFLVAFLQAYVFTVLTCIYLNDAIHLH